MRRTDIFISLLLCIITIIIKLPYLGDFLTIDEPRWVRGAGQFLQALYAGNFTETYWHFHPGITITWGEAIILWAQSWSASDVSLIDFINDRMDQLDQVIGAMRLSGVILTSLVLPFIYHLAKPLIGQWATILGVSLLALDPFLLAHTRIVNGDALAALLMMASCLGFMTLLSKPQYKYAFLAGLFAGLAFLTKLPSPMLVPIFAFLASVGYFKDRNWRFWLKALLISGLTATIVFIALWPAMWVAPLNTLQMMYEDTFSVGDIGGKSTVSFFLGQIRDRQSLIFYPLALLFRLTPINMLGLCLAIGFLWFAKRPPQPDAILAKSFQPAKLWVGLLTIYIVLVIVFATVSPKKEARYAMSVIPTVNLLAGVGWMWGIQRLKHPLVLTQTPTLITILIALQASFVLSSYPYLLTYYNPLVGGYAKAVELVPVGRGEGLEKAAAWINQQPDGATATISPYYRNVTNPYLMGKSLGFSNSGESQLLADYVVFYITQTQRKLPYPELADYFIQQDPIHIEYIGDTPYLWIYKKEQPITKLHGKPAIIGRARLVGYTQDKPNLQPGDTTTITLYFLTEDQDLPSNEDFNVALLDGAGQPQTRWQSAIENRWQRNRPVEWRGQLALPADIAPGDYRLKISLMDTNIDAEVTFFDFTEMLVNVER